MEKRVNPVDQKDQYQIDEELIFIKSQCYSQFIIIKNMIHPN